MGDKYVKCPALTLMGFAAAMLTWLGKDEVSVKINGHLSMATFNFTCYF